MEIGQSRQTIAYVNWRDDLSISVPRFPNQIFLYLSLEIYLILLYLVILT